MMSGLTGGSELGLDWLLPCPDDFRSRVRAFASADRSGEAAMALARHGMGVNALNQLAKALGKLRSDGRSLAPLSPFRLGLLGTGTLDLIAPQLVASAARHGLDLTCVTAPYGQLVQQAFDPASTINRAGCDAVLLALDYQDLPLAMAQAADGADPVEASLTFLRGLRNNLRRHGGATVIVQTLAEPVVTMFGHFDARRASTVLARVRACNQALALDLADGEDVLLDVAALAATVGTANWFSPSQWHLAKMPVAMACQPLYADHVCRVLGALRGKAKRCLILDLDNTLWGGVIGDDGMEGIRLGQGDPIGEAHLALQRYALMLHERGIVLAVCSKNEEAVARQVFREHPDMLLREEHIAVFQANWVDKASNIRAIAHELSLGLSSFVFVDDNPAERAIVRQQLPEVAVPELPADPALYERVLAAAGYFEAITFSQEDAARTGFYRDNARRAQLLEQSGDLGAYLASLNMQLNFAPFGEIGRERIVQLISKSNQFNLTTRRYGAVEVEAMAQDPDLITLQVRLSDCFGDNGMISVVILRPSTRDGEADVMDIDLWLMSCRVLGRRVEDAVLNQISRLARERGVRWLRGVFKPTDRNMIVRDHYAGLGFAPDGHDAHGATYWRWSTSDTRPTPPMQVTRSGFPASDEQDS